MAELPVLQPGAAPPERSDAARNRARILDAAARLVEQRGIGAVSMDDVAREACVGTGTLYRRFGDRAGLAIALLDDRTRAFQDAFIAGPPPLGPGAPPVDRLVAFGEGLIDLLEQHVDLLAEADPTGGPYGAYATHLTLLVGQAAPDLDAPLVAEALLAMLAPGPYVRMRRGLGWPADRVRDGWRAMVERLGRPGPP